MSCSNRTYPMTQMLVAASSTTEVYFPAGDWTSANGVDKVRAWLEVRGIPAAGNNLSIQPGIQYTNNPPNPGSNLVAVNTTAATANGVTDPSGLVTVGLGAYKYWRPVYLVKLTVGSTLAVAGVSGVLEVQGA